MAINWFWAHRRNTSLHHMSIHLNALKGKGFLPAVNFYFENQIIVSTPKKGCYLFYDRDEMNRKYKNVQDSIDSNENFAKDFKETQDKIFDDVFAVCDKIESTNLKNASDDEILALLTDFCEKITKGPLITVQLWGIEACWQEDYVLAKEIRNQVNEDECEKLKGILSISTGKSVAYCERESFLKILREMQKKELSENEINEKVKKHIKNYVWVNSEYISETWPFSKWLETFEKEMDLDAEEELKKLYANYQEAVAAKNSEIQKLKLSKQALHVIEALNEFVAQRDWSKGKFCYALAKYDPLLEEIGNRLKQTKDEILLYQVSELIGAVKNNKPLNISKRKSWSVLFSINGKHEVIDNDNVQDFINEQKIGDIFSEVKKVKSFKGVVACKGKVSGKIRVIDDPSEISDFQEDEILVTYMTTMEFTPIFKKAKGVITDEGGLSSHAAIISREFGLPCIVGTKIATRVLKTGDNIELDGDTGEITVL